MSGGVGFRAMTIRASEGVISGRSAQKAEATRADIARRSGNRNVDVLIADLSSLAAVRKLADSFLASHPALQTGQSPDTISEYRTVTRLQSCP